MLILTLDIATNKANISLSKMTLDFIVLRVQKVSDESEVVIFLGRGVSV